MSKLQNFLILCTLILCYSFFPNMDAFAFNEEITHPVLTERAVRSSDLNNYLITNLGIQGGTGENITFTTIESGNEVKIHRDSIYWLKTGSTDEDLPPCRAANHFHNPLKSSPWNDAQLNDDTTWLALRIRNVCINEGWPLDQRKSALVWATGLDGTTPIENPATNPPSPNTWWKARDYFYKALTMNERTYRDNNFIRTLQAVGQVMHLLEDMAVPAHVRNDFQSHLVFTGIHSFEDAAHISRWENNLFEYWLKRPENRAVVTNATAVKPDFSGSVKLTDFWDMDIYTGSNPSVTLQKTGLAEYTNANFVSDNTIFANDDLAHQFPYPSLVSSVTTTSHLIPDQLNPGHQITRDYYWKNGDGDSGYLLAGMAFGKFEADRIVVDPTNPIHVVKQLPLMDDNVHAGYAAKLIPHAIGYSAKLLDYFFRGSLEISAPDENVYGITDGSLTPYTDVYGNQHQVFTSIKAKIRNTTPNAPSETIGAGSLTAVAKYRMRTDYKPDLSADPTEEHPEWGLYETDYSYSVSASVTVDSLSSELSTDFVFDFTNHPIPAGITDLYLLVVFKGTLGNEADNAIAVGFKDLAEPAHHVFWNLTDMFSLLYTENTDTTTRWHLYTADQLMDSSDENKGRRELVDFNPKDGIFNEPGEPHIASYPMNFEIAYLNGTSQATPPLPVAKVDNLPAGRYMRLIILQDRDQPHMLRLSYSDQVDSGVVHGDVEFPEVINQKESDGDFYYMPVESFRHSLSNGAEVPIKDHFDTGILRCSPMGEDPVTKIKYCPYDEMESISADPNPYGPVEILFNQ